jgi:hypothetical protein
VSTVLGVVASRERPLVLPNSVALVVIAVTISVALRHRR